MRLLDLSLPGRVSTSSSSRPMNFNAAIAIAMLAVRPRRRPPSRDEDAVAGGLADSIGR